ncbi:hypothetical protein BRPE64_ACDS24590 [Caballeronia insecticola]|uniref:Uncharacterized protein n=1 Tax=Caballeronia insecticola TaxID=758793 RepID=R4WIL4_9BURK|nr:hypothetical protein BRPE64_ACDS24590 [Caballeronia insecticola]
MSPVRALGVMWMPPKTKWRLRVTQSPLSCLMSVRAPA